jgi:hypothetical protein
MVAVVIVIVGAYFQENCHQWLLEVVQCFKVATVNLLSFSPKGQRQTRRSMIQHETTT